MGNLNLNQAEDMKNKLIKSASKGSGHFFKNLLLISLVLLLVYIVTTPALLMNPKEYFANFDISSLYVFVAVVFIISGIFQLGRSIFASGAEDLSKEKKEQEELMMEQHKADIRKRINLGPEISSILKDVLINLNATRSTVCEMHNGTNSLGGVPFIYLSMNYEEISKEVEYSSEDFNNINMSRLPFIGQHFDKGSWIGSVEEIEQSDKFLATRLKLNGDNYLAFAVIYGKRSVLGVLTIAWKDEHPNKFEINQQLLRASQRLSILLDK